MKRKINRYLLFTVFLTLTATLLMAVMIFNHMYQEQIVKDMRMYGEALAGMVSSGEELSERYTRPQQELRVTAVDAAGTVVYDSQKGSDAMSNHRDRPEIQEAEKSGEGHVVRHSDTLDRDMYYFAIRLENGDVLRISKEADSICGMFQRTMFGITGIGVLMLMVCLILSHYMTESLMRPIEKLAEHIDEENMGEEETIDTYEELRPLIETIREQHRDIIKGAKLRQEFTANVSHELKTPLTAVCGYAELIETGIAGEKEVRRFAGEISRSARRLLTLINDIIRLSELDGGHADISFAEMDLYDSAAACVEMLQLEAGQHGVRIFCNGGPCRIYANKEMIEELLFNLCDNAIRYNKLGGSVAVTVGQRDGKALLSVKDSGIGIPKESQERVFERFYRVDKSRSKKTGGTGLGLAIVKHIVAQHGAELRMESVPGEGTEMTVIF